ncbi:hypothetical protein ECP03047778_4865 [Escherichia coli P0304777.8]|nr:hypothetical protein ECP03047778_4865 [Escherichia coli P0304777.8]
MVTVWGRLQSLVGGTVVGVRFTPVSGCGELRQRKQDADPEQEVIAAGASSSAANERGSASFVLSTPTKRMGVFPGDHAGKPAPGPIAVRVRLSVRRRG